MILKKAQLLKIREYYIKNMQFLETYITNSQTVSGTIRTLRDKLNDKLHDGKELSDDEKLYYIATFMATNATSGNTKIDEEIVFNMATSARLSGLLNVYAKDFDLPDDIELDTETFVATSGGQVYKPAPYVNKKSFKLDKPELLWSPFDGKTEEERVNVLNQLVTSSKLFDKKKKDYLEEHAYSTEDDFFLYMESDAIHSLKDLYVIDSKPEEKNKSAVFALCYVLKNGKNDLSSDLYKMVTEGFGLKKEDLEVLKSIVNGKPVKDAYKDIVKNTNEIGKKVENVINENGINAADELENDFYKTTKQKKKSLELKSKIDEVLGYKEAKAKYSEKVPKFEFKSLFSWLGAYFSRDASNLRKEIKAYEKSFKEKGMSPEFINNNSIDKIKENYKDKFEEVKEVLKEKKENKKELVDNIQLDQTTTKENNEKVQESENVLENEIVK